MIGLRLAEDQLKEQRILGWKVVVQRPLRHAHFPGDGVERRSCDAIAQQDLPRGGHDLLARLVAAQLATLQTGRVGWLDNRGGAALGWWHVGR